MHVDKTCMKLITNFVLGVGYNEHFILLRDSLTYVLLDLLTSINTLDK